MGRITFDELERIYSLPATLYSIEVYHDGTGLNDPDIHSILNTLGYIITDLTALACRNRIMATVGQGRSDGGDL